MRLKNNHMIQQSLFRRSVELACRVYVFVFINIYGLGKIAGGQFHRQGYMRPEISQKTLGDVGGFDLAWAFFGYSKTYVLFIGLSQVVGGFLLLWSRTKLLGAAILIPILLNIIFVDACFGIPAGAMFSAIIYLVLTLVMLYLNKERVAAAWVSLVRSDNASYNEGSSSARLKLIGLALLLTAVFFFIELFGIRRFAD